MNVEYKTMPVRKLKLFPGNPRKGNVDAIADSLSRNGQFQPIVVQKSTNYVLSGNHTLMAAKKLGWQEIEAAVVDVKDDHAKRIVLAANRTADMATYDHEALVALLESVAGDAVGTGYSEDEIALLVRTAGEASRDMELPRPNPVLDAITTERMNSATGIDPAPLGDDMDRPTPPPPPAPVVMHEPDHLKEAPDSLGGVVQLTDNVDFDGLTDWDIPRLLDDMLVDVVPEPLATWAGSATRDWPDPNQWWLYNYGIDSMSGMRDPSKAIMSFYCWDKYFENWWWYPARHTAKMLNTGIEYALTPNWGQGDCPKVISLYHLFRARWMGRYFQEAGIKVIPDITWRGHDHDYLREYVLGTLPDHVPVIAMQGQNVSDGYELDAYVEDLKIIFDHINPHTLILYAGPPGIRIFNSLGLKCRIIELEPRLQALHRLHKEKQARMFGAVDMDGPVGRA